MRCDIINSTEAAVYQMAWEHKVHDSNNHSDCSYKEVPHV